MTDPKPSLGRLKRRAEFLAVAKGRRAHSAAFTVQANRRVVTADVAPEVARVGFTVTKKVGTATERNRIRRRLREAVRASSALPTEPETDYVIVARREALSVPFDRLIAELEGSLRRSSNRSGARKRRTTEASEG